MLYPLSYEGGGLSLEAAGSGELRADGASPDRDGKSSWHFSGGLQDGRADG